VPAGIPDNEEAGVRDGCLVIRQKDLEEVFDPVIDRIVMLIAEQIEAVSELPGKNKVSAILLVGGFGSSEYLRRKIEGNPIWEGTDVIQPVNAYLHPASLPRPTRDLLTLRTNEGGLP